MGDAGLLANVLRNLTLQRQPCTKGPPRGPQLRAQPCYQATHLTASEATWSYTWYGVFLIHSGDTAEVFLSKLQQLLVLHPCRDRGCQWLPRLSTGSRNTHGIRTGEGKIQDRQDRHLRARQPMALGTRNLKETWRMGNLEKWLSS